MSTAPGQLQYCQTALAVERQDPYLHRLEEEISARLGESELFSCEGKAYLRAYPAVLNWAWFCYVILFPLAVFIGPVGLVAPSWRDLDYGLWHKSFMTLAGAALVTSFALYQVTPRLQRGVGCFKKRRQN